MQTRKLTILMAHQDGTPFAGYASVKLSSASKTDEELVGPLVWQESEFDENGKVELDIVPNTELEEGTCYRCQIYVTKSANGTKSKSKIVDTAFQMPDADSYLHELAIVEPMKPSAQEVVERIASEMFQAVESAGQDYSDAVARIGALEEQKAPLASPALTGEPTAPTPEAGDNSTKIATTEFVQTAVAGIVNSAPQALDTLKELSDALGGDANFSATVAQQIGEKLNASSSGYVKTMSMSGATLTLTLGDGSTANVALMPEAAGNADIDALFQ